MSENDDGFDWVSDDTGESSEPDEETLAAVEHLRKCNVELKRERYHLRQRMDSLQQQCDTLEEKVTDEQEEVRQVQENALEMYDVLAEQYDGGVPKQMLVGTLLNNCEASEEQAEQALRGLINTGQFIEDKHHVRKPE